MTATVEQIAEVLRKHSLRGGGGCAGCDWDQTDVGWIEHKRAHATHQAEQVAALGVGDGEVEWGVREEGRTTASCSREDAEGWINDEDAWNPGEVRTLVRRTVGPWVEVTDERGEG